MILRMCCEAISVKEKVGKKLLFDKCALVAKKYPTTACPKRAKIKIPFATTLC